MFSTLLFAAAIAAALVAAGLHARAGRWRRPLRLLLHLLAPLLAAASIASAPNVDIVEKLLTALIVPAGALWVATFVLVWWLLLRQRRRQAAVALAAWCAFTLAGNVWVGQAMLAWLEDGFAPAPPGARFDAVMVLGGGSASRRGARRSWARPAIDCAWAPSCSPAGARRSSSAPARRSRS
jgi:hypothetical protein